MEWRLKDRAQFERLQLLTDENTFGDALNKKFKFSRPDPRKLYRIEFGKTDIGGTAFSVVVKGDQLEVERNFDPDGWNDMSKVSPRPDPSIVYQVEVDRRERVECYAALWNQHTRGWRTAAEGRLITTVGAESVRFKKWRKGNEE